MPTNPVLGGGLRNVKYVAASRFRPVETSALVSFLVGDNEIRLSLTDARTLAEVLPNVLAEHSIALALAPLMEVV